MASFTTTAAPEARGQRLDRFLADAIGTLSRSRVKTLIEQGHARRDGVVLSEPSDAVRPGATYELAIPPPAPATPQPQAIPLPILYEDADLIVLDKPAGLVVHPAPGNEDGTLVNALLAHCGEQFTGIGDERRPGIVHRLDKDTSGVMVVAKTQLANTALTAAFAARDLDRAYLALVWGLPSPLEGEIEGDIGRDRRERKRMAVVTRNGKPALTHYRVLRSWGTAVSLLECRLATGERIRSGCIWLLEATPLWAIHSIYGGRRPSPDHCRDPSALTAGFPASGAARGTPWLRPSTQWCAVELQQRSPAGHGENPCLARP